WMQEITKWFNLPYPQALVGLDEVAAALKKAEKTDPGNLIYALLPVLSRADMTTAQLDRRIAMLRCLEAVRSYAAAHEGKLPADLKNLSQSPAPLDPLTAVPFGYEAHDGGFVLEAA